MSPDLLAVGVRALGFMALFQAIGSGFFLAVFGGQLSRTQASIRRLGIASAIAGGILVTAHLGLDATRLAGDFAGLWDSDLQRLAWTSRSGISQLVQIVGLLTMLPALRRTGTSSARWAIPGGILAVCGFLITGHTSTHALRAVLGPLLALHLLIVAFWFGSLIPLIIVIRQEPPAAAVALLERFSAIAGWLVPLILVAGLAMAWLLCGSIAVLHEPYGELLLVKLAGFAALMVLAACNKWRLAISFAKTGSDSALRRSMLAEYTLMIAVLAVTAVLTAFYSPD